MIDSDGKMAGVFAVAEAIKMAENQGLDLIEIAPMAKPPTCKIIDYGKWKYESKKKEKVARKKQTIIVIKEIQVRPRTGQHDLDVKLRHARRFLLGGDKVKVNLRFHGREMAHQELGVRLLNKISKLLDDIANPEAAPKKEGRQMFVLLAPDPVKIKEYQNANPETPEEAAAATAAAEAEAKEVAAKETQAEKTDATDTKEAKETDKQSATQAAE